MRHGNIDSQLFQDCIESKSLSVKGEKTLLKYQNNLTPYKKQQWA